MCIPACPRSVDENKVKEEDILSEMPLAKTGEQVTDIFGKMKRREHSAFQCMEKGSRADNVAVE